MTDKQIEELINKALQEEQALPEGLSERLEQYIDTLPAAERSYKHAPAKIKQFLYWTSGAAAAVLIGGILFFNTTPQSASYPVDTFTDPQEAAAAAQKVLVLVSTQLNLGMDQVAEAGQEIENATQLINTSLK